MSYTLTFTDKHGHTHRLTANARFIGITSGPLRYSMWQGYTLDINGNELLTTHTSTTKDGAIEDAIDTIEKYFAELKKEGQR